MARERGRKRKQKAARAAPAAGLGAAAEAVAVVAAVAEAEAEAEVVAAPRADRATESQTGSARVGRTDSEPFKDEADRRLADLAFFAGEEISSADFVIVGWVWRHERHKIDLANFPHVSRWYRGMMALWFAVALER